MSRQKGDSPDFTGFMNVACWVQDNGDLVIKLNPYITLKKPLDKSQQKLSNGDEVEIKKIPQ